MIWIKQPFPQGWVKPIYTGKYTWGIHARTRACGQWDLNASFSTKHTFCLNKFKPFFFFPNHLRFMIHWKDSSGLAAKNRENENVSERMRRKGIKGMEQETKLTPEQFICPRWWRITSSKSLLWLVLTWASMVLVWVYLSLEDVLLCLKDSVFIFQERSWLNSPLIRYS